MFHVPPLPQPCERIDYQGTSFVLRCRDANGSSNCTQTRFRRIKKRQSFEEYVAPATPGAAATPDAAASTTRPRSDAQANRTWMSEGNSSKTRRSRAGRGQGTTSTRPTRGYGVRDTATFDIQRAQVIPSGRQMINAYSKITRHK